MTSRDAYDRWLAREIESLLRNGFNNVVTTLVTRYDDLTIAQKTRQLQLFGNVEKYLSDGYGEASKFAQKQLDAYAGVESTVERAHLQSIVARGDINMTFDTMSRAQIRNIAAMPIGGLHIGDWWEKQAADMSLETRRHIQMGLLAGETPQQIVRRIMPSDTSAPAVLRTARRNASTLVRTSLTAVQNNVSLETMQAAGAKVTTAYRYIAVRDARTSKICAALSNKVFAFTDKQKKMPPQHPNCRSTIIAIINYEKLGLPKQPYGKQTPLSFQSYDAWLKEQTPDMQSVILGPSRAAFYRDGRMSLSEMVATDNRVLTLTQLEQRFATTAPESPIVTRTERQMAIDTAEQRYRNVVTKFAGAPANPDAIDLLRQYTLDGSLDGPLTPERQELHDAILQKIRAGHLPQENPIVSITGGGPASGKSVLQARAAKLADPVHVDVDEIRELLPEWGNKTIEDIGTFTHEEASRIAKAIIKVSVKEKVNVVNDGAFDGGYHWLETKIAGFKESGARVVANYVTVDADTALARSINRGDEMIMRGQTPRYVPEDYLRRMHCGVSKDFPEAIKHGIFDEFSLWDTNGPTPIRVVSGTTNNLTIHDQPAWERFLAKADEC